MSSRFLSICALEKRETEQGGGFFSWVSICDNSSDSKLPLNCYIFALQFQLLLIVRLFALKRLNENRTKVASTSKYSDYIFSDRIFFLRPFNIFGILKNARKISLSLARIQGREDTFPIEKEKRETRSWLAAALSATLRSARNGSPQFVRLKLSRHYAREFLLTFLHLSSLPWIPLLWARLFPAIFHLATRRRGGSLRTRVSLPVLAFVHVAFCPPLHPTKECGPFFKRVASWRNPFREELGDAIHAVSFNERLNDANSGINFIIVLIEIENNSLDRILWKYFIWSATPVL